MVQIPQSRQLITDKKNKKASNYSILGDFFFFNFESQPCVKCTTYFPMKILRSGPFPRKSSGACRFLVGLLGLSSVDLFQWGVKTPSYTESTSQRKPLAFVILLYLSLTKLGQPSFFQPFQFSSVSRMCCLGIRWYILLPV